LYVHYQKIRH